MRAAPAGPHGDDILEQLVHQFTDAYAFVRELIQNAIDAGSRKIEVELSYRPAAGTGTASVAVADWGEGMNRDVIERFLVTKFRSSKEGDLTKIGKFGIGFMSVFAIAPELVVVETGRDGEDWRVLFHPDRTYELRRAPAPLEGTRVIIQKSIAAEGAGGYGELVHRCREAVRRWCRHSEVEVTFAAGDAGGGRPHHRERVREPFALDALVSVEHRDARSVVIAGLARREPPFAGFYNRGLTLHETHQSVVPGITFKVLSDLLAHTLTRDDVKKDEGYALALEKVRELSRGPLSEKLAEALKDAAAGDDPGPDLVALLDHAQLAGRLDLARTWFPTFGAPVDGATLRRVAKKAGHVPAARERSPIVEALTRSGKVVARLVGDEHALRAHLVRASGQDVAVVDDVFTLAELPRPTGAEDALARELRGLLRALSSAATGTVVATIHGASAAALHAMVDAPGVSIDVRRAAASPFARDAPPILCLNRSHRAIAAATRLAATRPRVAAYLVCRLLALGTGSLGAERDRALTLAALS